MDFQKFALGHFGRMNKKLHQSYRLLVLLEQNQFFLCYFIKHCPFRAMPKMGIEKFTHFAFFCYYFRKYNSMFSYSSTSSQYLVVYKKIFLFAESIFLYQILPFQLHIDWLGLRNKKSLWKTKI